MPMKKTLRELLKEESCVMAPEIYDCASAMAAEFCGYNATVLSGAELSMAMKGVPDLGIMNVEELIWATQRICDYSELPCVIDAENGYGPALTAAYNCKRLAKAGAAGVIIVDSPEVRIGGESLPIEEACGKYRACADALKGTDCILIARTDVETLDEAIERCVAYREAGADMTLVFMINSIRPEDRFEACKKIAEKDKGWKWYPDLGAHNGKSDVTLEEIAEYGYNFVGIHYMLAAALTAMIDAGTENKKNRNNVYATYKYTASAIGTEEQLDSWYETEKPYVVDKNLRMRWPYSYHLRNKAFEENK
jgi:2-methylisocitrate lyase-like PEP mutase family enzyme